MTTQEFSNTFDTLLNSYATRAMFGDQASRQEIVLDEYEKSVLLTQAQDIIVKQYFERNNVDLGFDDSERRQIDFSSLITVASSASAPSASGGFAERSWLFNVPTTTVTVGENSTIDAKVLFILNERLVLTKSNSRTNVFVVVPINYHEYDRQMSKPFAQPLKKQAWRLLKDDNSALTAVDGAVAEIVPTDVAWHLAQDGYAPSYKIRFVRRPCPIVLVPLADTGLTVDGVTEVTECELNPIIHMDILNKAVELAYTTRGARPVEEKKSK